MKPHIKIVALASIVIVGVWAASFIHSARDATDCATVTLSGWITPDTFFSNRQCLESSTAANKKVVITGSNGGNWESALALGILIHRHGWDVEVVDFCASSCANFIFPAGKVKYLHAESLLIFHGGPHQANLREQFEAYDRAVAARVAPAVNSEPAGNPERNRMEGYADYDPEGAADRRRVREFLRIEDAPTEVELFDKLRAESDRFYQDLGVNVALPTYGQVGRYEPIYKAYKYSGFTYPLDSLRRLGIRNIEVKGGAWHPERHRDYHDLYEVTYP